MTRGNLRSKIFLIQKARKIMTPYSYRSSNLSLIALKTLRLLVHSTMPYISKVIGWPLSPTSTYTLTHPRKGFRVLYPCSTIKRFS